MIRNSASRLVPIVIAAALLSACSPGGAPPSASPTPTRALTAIQRADLTTTTCMTGSWTLDDDDYAEQNRQWLTDKGLPIELYRTTGTATLTFTADTMTFHNATSTNAVVGGHSYNIGLDRTGSSPWHWTDDEQSVLTLDDWAWNTPDPTTGATIRVATFFDPTPGSKLEVTCDGPLLELHGPDADITGRFNRS